MRCRYIFLAAVLFLFLLSVHHANAAVIYGGKLFHSENFTTLVGGSFKIFGSDAYKKLNNVTGVVETHYSNVVVMSNIDSTVMIFDGDCSSTKVYKYCYKGTSVDFDDERTFEGGDIRSQMTLTIESLPPPSTIVTFTRDALISTHCGLQVHVPILVQNSGGIATNVTYTEMLPIDTMVMDAGNGTLEGDRITFRDRLPENRSKVFAYTIASLNCRNKQWNATYSFTTHNDTLWRNLTNLALVFNSSYRINESVSPKRVNGFSEAIYYSFNIENIHPSKNLYLDITISAPGLIAREASNGISNEGANYRYSGFLYTGRGRNLSILFNPTQYGDLTLTNDAIIKVDEYRIDYNSSNQLQVIHPIMTALIDVNDSVNNSMLVNIYVDNDNLKEKYYYLYGVLTVMGEEEPIHANSIEPDTRIVAGSRRYNTTGMGIKELNVTFSGVYRDKDNKDYSIYAERTVKVNSPYSNPNILIENKTQTENTAAQTPASPSTPSTPSDPGTDKDTKDSEKKNEKDLITRIIEGLSRFLESIFG